MSTEKHIVMLTDYNWMSYLSKLKMYDTVNFWTPSPWNVKFTKGDSVYFLSKQQYGRKICGSAKFVEYKNMKIEEAWQIYGEANGSSSLAEMIKSISSYLPNNSSVADRQEIGCIILEDIVFFSEENQILPEAYGWEIPRQVVKYKIFDTLAAQ